MGPVLLELLPVIVAAALLPVWIIIVLMLLSFEKGVAKAAAFLAGATSVRLLQGILFALFFADSNVHSETGPIVATLLLVLGLLLLITGWKKWRKEEDPDAPPPAWMNTLATMSVAKAFGFGALLMAVAVKLWVFTLSALGIISAAELGLAAGVTLYLVYLLAAQALMLLPLLLAALAPGLSARLLPPMRAWLDRYNRPITITVSLVFGLFFLWKGLSALL